MADFDEVVNIKRHHLDELRFYGYAGICISRFQQIDDHLQDPFAKLLTISSEQAEIVFSSIRAVKQRCDVIAKLLKERSSEYLGRWTSLTRRILQAEVHRNSIAHGSPAFNGGTITIRIDPDTDETELVSQTEGFFQLEKRGHIGWTTDTLLTQAREMEMLLSDLYAFCADVG